MSTISIILDEEKINDLLEQYKNYIKPINNPYAKAFIKLSDATITIYNSGKTVVQGEASEQYARLINNKKIEDEAGSDEVGTGDYFGPVCVCACIIKKEDNELINNLNIKDSKQLKDTDILKIAPILTKKIIHSLLILDPVKYNEVYKENNLVAIKAKMHNQAYINLLHKGHIIPENAYVDQFVSKKTYFKYLEDSKEIYTDLIFETKAENKHPAVAIASIISRYAFLIKIKQLEDKYGLTFHKGAGAEADLDAIKFIHTYGFERLNEVAKLHFKNTYKIKELI